ncbi:MAG: ATP phosphoribosyltransferase [Chloroflexi bacterium]|nr:ATP phosphoribosyltransferase [Chloroflexota bacterium]
MMAADGVLKLAVPSDGEMHEPTLGFLRQCGMPVARSSARGYTAIIPAVEDVTVLFQRAADITSKVEEGSAHLGVVGMDRYMETSREGGESLVIIEDLGFSRCELAIAVPDSWVDVTSVADLADLAVEFRGSGRELRVATKYPRMVQRFMYQHGINYFMLVVSSGTLEAAPTMGYADIIGDLVSTGITLRENRLKTLEDGTILSSQACLIGNRTLLGAHPGQLEAARAVVERIEAYLSAGEYRRVTVNVRGDSREAVAAQVLERPEVAGLHGPTVSQVFGPDGARWFSVTVFVDKDRVMDAVDHFRAIGGSTVTVSQVNYIFHSRSQAYDALLRALGR